MPHLLTFRPSTALEDQFYSLPILLALLTTLYPLLYSLLCTHFFTHYIVLNAFLTASPLLYSHTTLLPHLLTYYFIPNLFNYQARESSLVPVRFLTAQFLQKLWFMEHLFCLGKLGSASPIAFLEERGIVDEDWTCLYFSFSSFNQCREHQP